MQQFRAQASEIRSGFPVKAERTAGGSLQELPRPFSTSSVASVRIIEACPMARPLSQGSWCDKAVNVVVGPGDGWVLTVLAEPLRPPMWLRGGAYVLAVFAKPVSGYEDLRLMQSAVWLVKEDL